MDSCQIPGNELLELLHFITYKPADNVLCMTRELAHLSMLKCHEIALYKRPSLTFNVEEERILQKRKSPFGNVLCTNICTKYIHEVYPY